MGLLPCPLLCRASSGTDSHSPKQLHSDSSSSSLSSISSQSSLPSIPSLTHPNSHPPSSSAHHHCIATLHGHSSAVFSLALAGKNLLTSSSDGQIRIWCRPPSPDNHNNLIAAGYSAVKSMVFTGDKLFTAHQDHKIRVWRIENEKYKFVAALPTLNDRLARVFSAKNYVEVRRHVRCTWVHHVDTISALALSRDGSLLYSASWDRSFKIWRTSDFKCLESVWNAHDDAINALVLSDDGFVYTGSADRKIKVWKREEGGKKHRLVATLEKHKSAVNALALSTDGHVLYSGACDRSIIVWEKESSAVGGGDDGSDGGYMAVAGALRGHTKAILCLAVVGDLVCSGSADKTVRIWRRGNENGSGNEKNYWCLGVLEGHRGPIKCLVAAVDHSTAGSGDSNSCSHGNSYKVYSGSLDSDTKVWQFWVPILQ